MKKILIIILGILLTSSSVAQETIIIDSQRTIDDNQEFYDLTITPSGILTIASTGKVIVTNSLTNNGTESNLIIQDGGQLINKERADGNNTIKATFHKNIANYVDEELNNGWYTISIPVYLEELTSTNFINVIDSYDLFKYIEEYAAWLSYKDDSNIDYLQQVADGFLYAHNFGDTDKVFKGVLYNNKTYTKDLTASCSGGLLGFNLIGNPYPFEIYKGHADGISTALDDSGLANGFYYLNNDNHWEVGSYNTPIKPGQSILVKTATGHEVNINKSSIAATRDSQSGSAKGNDNSIELLLLSANGNDKIVIYFYDGLGLDKIDNFSDIPPMLCVRHENKDYAIACVGEQCNSLDVVFKTTQSGFFTIQLSELVGDYNYLHLIDNVTGDDIDLLKEESYKFYSFGNENDSRFKLLTSSNTGISITDNDTFAYILNGDIIITGLEGNATLQVFDVMGRLVGNEVVCGTSGVVCRANKPNTTGVYVLRLITGNGIKTQKIVVE